MVNFFLAFEKVKRYSKKDIDIGKTPSIIYKICSCIRETFCLSYAIRKSNNLYLYFFNERKLIKLEGKSLKYLGPDERSQVLLLLKALNQLLNLPPLENYGWRKSTPGIYVRQFSNDKTFIDFITSNKFHKKLIIIDETNLNKTGKICFFKAKDLKRVENINTTNVFLFDFNNKKKFTELIKIITEGEEVMFMSLSKIKGIDLKILYLNYLIDNMESVEMR